MKRFTGILISSVLLMSFAGFSTPVTAQEAPPPAEPMVVGTDPADDWGSEVGPVQPIGDALGQELVEASIGMADPETINFIIKVNSLPSIGGMPEMSRYNWDMIVDSTAFQLTGAYTEYLRGICNPLHTNSCPPPQDPGMQPFFVRQGSCLVGEECHVIGRVQATFDQGAGTITIPVPLELLEAEPGSVIATGASSFGPAIYAAPALFVSNTAAPSDTMVVDQAFTIPSEEEPEKPKKKKKKG
ncbi:MAG TPA: hypothetical protein VHJ82_06400 [Actinomycetota bacterium]|nr:hypothetical protein [Actinomycetota bacterium]